jgi:hypothetical protein
MDSKIGPVFLNSRGRWAVERVGVEYAIVLADGRVYGARTYASLTEASSVAMQLSQGITPPWRPRTRVA